MDGFEQPRPRPEDDAPLLATRRFLPLFVAQFLGAFTDNLIKNAIVIIAAFHLADELGAGAHAMPAVAGAVLLAPFLILSALAGQIADRYSKIAVLRVIKLGEIAIMALAGMALIRLDIGLLLLSLGLLGIQATFLSPVKYGVLPELLRPRELVSGNALVEGGSFAAILSGTIIGGLLAARPGGEVDVAVLGILAAIGGVVAAWFVPGTEPIERALKLTANPWAASRAVLAETMDRKVIRDAIYGTTLIWVVGAAALSLFPSLVKDVFGGEAEGVTLLMVVFTLGVALGAGLCAKVLKGRVSAKHAPVAGVLLAAFTIDLAYSAHHPILVDAVSGGGFWAPFLSGHGVRLMVDVFGLAAAGGFYIVPLYALMQERAPPRLRARVIAANNIVNAIGMVGSQALLAAAFYLGAPLTAVLIATALLILVSALWSVQAFAREPEALPAGED